MQSLINESTSDINIPFLDQKVASFYNGDREAQLLLVRFAESPSSSQYVTKILKKTTAEQTKSFALTILLNSIKTRWNLFRVLDRVNMRNFVIATLLDLLKSPDKHPTLIPLLNNIIIEIVKREWPHNWPKFVPELLAACKINDIVCANNLHILRMIIEDVNENEQQLTIAQRDAMKPTLISNFSHIFELCLMIIDSSENTALLKSTLGTLHSSIRWLPLKFIFVSPLIKILIFKLFSVDLLKNIIIQCLHAIAAIEISHDELYKWNSFDVIQNMFKVTIQKTSSLLSLNLPVLYNENRNEFRNYILFLTNFVTTIMGKYGARFDGLSKLHEEIYIAHMILIKISWIDDRELFKICLEYWDLLTKSLTELKRRNDTPINLGRMHSVDNDKLVRYEKVLTQLRAVIIEKMERPKEVLIVEDEFGNVVKEEMHESYSKELHLLTKNCLLNCAELDYEQTRSLMYRLLEDQVHLNKINVSRLNAISWAIGAIRGAMTPSQENAFLVHVIKEMLFMCDQRRSKDQKAVIASCIMFIVVQYPRFLREHWRFLKTVANKLFEFMHESFPGVKQMAVETFYSVARKCAIDFVRVQEEQFYSTPFICEMLSNFDSIVSDLEFDQVCMFYEAMGCIIAAERNLEIQKNLIVHFLKRKNDIWCRAMSGTVNQIDDNLSSLIEIAKINVSVAKGLGSSYEPQLAFLCESLLKIFQHYSNKLSNCGIEQKRKKIQIFKAEIIHIFEVYVNSLSQKEIETITTKLLPLFNNYLLKTYAALQPLERDHNVISLFNVLIYKLGSKTGELAKNVFDSLVKSTFVMIQRNFDDFPDHRVKVYRLLKTIVVNCFKVVVSFDQADFNTMMMALYWAIKHHNDEISKLGLETIQTIIENFERSTVFKEFYKAHLIMLITEVLSVLSDTMHKSDFELQTVILSKLFYIVQSGDITEPIYNLNTNFTNNRLYVKATVMDLISKKFSNRLTQTESVQFVDGLLQKSMEIASFREIVNDFLLHLKEIKNQNACSANVWG